MPDGTVKQINPFTGNEVWAVPGRGLRPRSNGDADHEAKLLSGDNHTAVCSFCSDRYLETPPEKFRHVITGDHWSTLTALNAGQYFDTVAEFRCVANMFEIVKLDYWQKNYGYKIPLWEHERLMAYAAEPTGMAHLRSIIDYKASLRSTKDPAEIIVSASLTDQDVLKHSEQYFGGCHEMIVGRDHYRNQARTERDLTGSGSLDEAHHYQYFSATVESVQGILKRNRYVRYVSVFQNWLQPAGASFDHLHKQIVGLDEWGASIMRQVKMLKRDPNVFNEFGANFAAMHNLVFAENDYAIAFVGIGHRFPTIEIFSKSVHARPWEHTPEELRGVSEMVRACHAAAGEDISCNEEWYYSPVDSVVKMPWHVLIKWRINVTAGFEGGTSIYINPMTPIEMRDFLVPRLYALRGEGRVYDLAIAEECRLDPNPLKYYLNHSS